jgi:hypothetical protein
MTQQRTQGSTPFLQTLLGRKMLVIFTLVLTYGGGFWLFLLHEIEGATEPDAPPPVLHWLRDSSLSLPLVALGVFLGAALARALLRRFGQRSSGLIVGSLAAVVISFYGSVVLSIGNPIHGILFSASVHGGGHDLPVGVHVVRDGLLALSANEVLAVMLATAVLSLHLIRSSRSLAPQR